MTEPFDVTPPDLAPEDLGRAGHRGRVIAALFAVVGAVALVVALVLPGGTHRSAGTGHDVTLARANGSLSVGQINHRVDPAVVDVLTTVASPVGELGTEQAAGTGMVLSSNGVILTNNHVVEQATEISVTIAGRHGTVPARVIGVDTTDDVALLKVNVNSPLTHISTSSRLRDGQMVVAIGNAQGYGGTPTTTTGAITALGRTITAGEDGDVFDNIARETLTGMIQTDAMVQQGDSGGPLVNSTGQVIGMDTAAATAPGGTAPIGFAIPITRALHIAHEISTGVHSRFLQFGPSPFVGIVDQPTTESTTSPVGVVVAYVIKDSPAAAIGLQSGDLVTSVDGQQVTSWTQFESLITARHPGDAITLGFIGMTGEYRQATTHLAQIVR